MIGTHLSKLYRSYKTCKNQILKLKRKSFGSGYGGGLTYVGAIFLNTLPSIGNFLIVGFNLYICMRKIYTCGGCEIVYYLYKGTVGLDKYYSAWRLIFNIQLFSVLTSVFKTLFNFKLGDKTSAIYKMDRAMKANAMYWLIMNMWTTHTVLTDLVLLFESCSLKYFILDDWTVVVIGKYVGRDELNFFYTNKLGHEKFLDEDTSILNLLNPWNVTNVIGFGRLIVRIADHYVYYVSRRYYVSKIVTETSTVVYTTHVSSYEFVYKEVLTIRTGVTFDIERYPYVPWICNVLILTNMLKYVWVQVMGAFRSTEIES